MATVDLKMDEQDLDLLAEKVADVIDGRRRLLLSIDDAAEILGISRAIVKTLVKDGVLAPFPWPNGMRRTQFVMPELERFVASTQS